jgi:hypothetical protein
VGGVYVFGGVGGGGGDPLNACYVIRIYTANRASHTGGPGPYNEPGDRLF